MEMLMVSKPSNKDLHAIPKGRRFALVPGT